MDCLNCDLGGFGGLTVIAGVGRGRLSVLLTLAGDSCREQANVGELAARPFYSDSSSRQPASPISSIS